MDLAQDGLITDGFRAFHPKKQFARPDLHSAILITVLNDIFRLREATQETGHEDSKHEMIGVIVLEISSLPTAHIYLEMWFMETSLRYILWIVSRKSGPVIPARW